VLEDDDRVRATTVAMLDDLGCLTIQADCAQTALRQIDAHPDVAPMFTDIVMPDINGRKLADQALKHKPGLKVLFTTGFTRNAVVHNGELDAGVQYLQKPFTSEELATKVRDALDDRLAEG
jgi:DNA-binding NtrC family response regulator